MGYSEEYFILVQLGAREVKDERKRIIYRITKFEPQKKEKRNKIIKLKLKLK